MMVKLLSKLKILKNNLLLFARDDGGKFIEFIRF